MKVLPHREAKMAGCRPAFGWYELAVMRLENQARILWVNAIAALCPKRTAKLIEDTDALEDWDEVRIGTREAWMVGMAQAERGSY